MPEDDLIRFREGPLGRTIMTTVLCSNCHKENEPSENWNYCRGCGARLELPASMTTVIPADGDEEAVTATAARPAMTRRTLDNDYRPRRATRPSKPAAKTAREIHQEMRWWTLGLVLGGGLLGMLVGSILKKPGGDDSLMNDPFYGGLVGGLLLGGVIAQLLIWMKQRQHG
jgi:hypothetical protein